MASELDRQFNRVHISARDMERCIEFLECAETAKAAEDFKVLRGLITAAIVSYGRPFSGNNNHENAIPSPPFSEKQLTDLELETHQKVLSLRNKAVAHSDAEMNPTSATMYRATGFSISSRLYDPLQEMHDLAAFHALARKIYLLFQGKLFELSKKASSQPSGQ